MMGHPDSAEEVTHRKTLRQQLARLNALPAGRSCSGQAMLKSETLVPNRVPGLLPHRHVPWSLTS